MDVGVFGEGEFDDGLFGGFAEEEADGGVFVSEFYLAVVVVHNHLHLAEVLIGELVELEVDEHERLLQQILRPDDELVFLGELADDFLVPAEALPTGEVV